MAVPDEHVLYGDALSAAGRYADAAAAYQKAGNLAFTEGTALRMVAAFGRAGNPASAMTVLRLYTTQNPLRITANRLAAKDALETGQWERAGATRDWLRRRPGGEAAILLPYLAWAGGETGN